MHPTEGCIAHMWDNTKYGKIMDYMLIFQCWYSTLKESIPSASSGISYWHSYMLYWCFLWVELAGCTCCFYFSVHMCICSVVTAKHCFFNIIQRWKNRLFLYFYFYNEALVHLTTDQAVCNIKTTWATHTRFNWEKKKIRSDLNIGSERIETVKGR